MRSTGVPVKGPILYGPDGQVLFSAARLAADNLSLPTAPDVLAVLMGYDGTDLNLLRVDATNNALHSALIGAAPAGSVRADVHNAGNDAQSNAVGQLVVQNRGLAFNGTTWDRWRNNNETTLLTSAARTTTQTSADLPTYNARSLQVVVDITAYTSGGLTVTIDMKDSASGKYINLLTSASLAAAATTRLRIGPNVAAVANLSAVDYLPKLFRIVVTAADGTSITYSVGYHLGI